jgi:hypothetical protein
MATNFPTSVDVLTNPVSNDSLNSPSHSAQHANANDAIEAIETTLFTGGINYTGLIHLSTQTFTASTGVNVDSVFNATYQNYKVIIEFTGSAVSYATVGFQYRASGSSLSANEYYANAAGIGTDGAIKSLATAPSTSAFMTAIYSPTATKFDATFMSPFVSTTTTTAIFNHSYQTASAGTFSFGGGGIYYGTVTTVDGFRFTCSNAMTGTVRIYGLRNA